MRTSLDFPDELFRHLKLKAAHDGMTFRDVVVDLLQRGLAAPAPTSPVRREIPMPPQIDVGRVLIPPEKLTNAGLFEIINQEDDEKILKLMRRGR